MSTAKKIFRGPLVWIAIIILAIIIAMNIYGSATGYRQVPTSQVVSVLNSKTPVDKVELVDGEQTIRLTQGDGAKLEAQWVGNQSQELIQLAQKKQAAGTLKEWNSTNPSPGFLGTLLINAFPILLLVIGFIVVMSLFQGGMGGGRGVMGFGKSRAKIANKDTPQTTFKDVAGATEAVEELDEIREFLAEPDKFRRVGAKIPKGVLLYGPPGTGKTLLARAVAGEAGVPFYSISGSDFVEMFVGVGASRVRDLFEQAKTNAPAIVFIDEIDAVGRHRGAGMGGGHDEREQTLNQLLVEMDGFDATSGVILIAATNRPDVLDPALLRPGRFDRQIAVEAPDMDGRAKILQVHAHGKPLADNVDLVAIARRTPGFTGADLANVLNEAALLTARLNLPLIGNAQLDEAIDRVIAGPQKRTRLMNEHERLVTAYHEGGHALVASAMPGVDPVQKFTILPRGRALGYAMVMPDEDKYSQTRGELLGQMAYMMGGRAAEELIFHDPSTGASNDIEKATKVARAMVTQYGFSERIGTITLGGDDSEPFLGMTQGTNQGRNFSDQTAAIIDSEVAKLLEVAHQEAFDVLVENRELLDELVRQVLIKETLNRAELDELFKGLEKWPARGAFTGSDKRQPSDVPPVEVPERPEIEQGPDDGHGGQGAIGAGPDLPDQGPGSWNPPSDWAPPTPGAGPGSGPGTGQGPRPPRDPYAHPPYGDVPGGSYPQPPTPGPNDLPGQPGSTPRPPGSDAHGPGGGTWGTDGTDPQPPSGPSPWGRPRDGR